MADIELNLTHQINPNDSIEIEETKSDGTLDNTIILTHQIDPKTTVEGEFDTTTGVKTAILDYDINQNTDVEVEQTNIGQITVELNVKI